MVKHTQTNCLSVFDLFVGLALKGLRIIHDDYTFKEIFETTDKKTIHKKTSNTLQKEIYRTPSWFVSTNNDIFEVRENIVNFSNFQVQQSSKKGTVDLDYFFFINLFRVDI